MNYTCPNCSCHLPWWRPLKQKKYPGTWGAEGRDLYYACPNCGVGLAQVVHESERKALPFFAAGIALLLLAFLFRVGTPLLVAAAALLLAITIGAVVYSRRRTGSWSRYAAFEPQQRVPADGPASRARG